MKIVYEFDTNDENFDRQELEIFKQAQAMALALSEIQQKVRSWAKYEAFPKLDKQNPIDYVVGSEKFCEEINEFIEKGHKIPDIYQIRDDIYDIIKESGVDLDRMGY